LRQINPDDTDWGAIWEQHKQEFVDKIGNPYFQYGLGSTAIIVWLFVVLFLQHVSHRRAQELAVQSMSDIRRHDEYARQAAREAIRRYNEHIESCNRVIEAAESGASKWISSAELEALDSEAQQARSEAAALREETKRLREEIQKQSNVIAGTSMRSGDAQTTCPLQKTSRVGCRREGNSQPDGGTCSRGTGRERSFCSCRGRWPDGGPDYPLAESAGLRRISRKQSVPATRCCDAAPADRQLRREALQNRNDIGS